MKHVTFHLPSFLRRVRIHGGEFDSSARAMNREEQVRLLQADLRIVRGSTIERKHMSTTIKRIALVAVAALGLGVLSVAPSQAAVQNLAVTVTNGTATLTKQDTTTAASVVVEGLLDGGLADTITVSVIEKSKPAGTTPVALLGYLETTTLASRVDTSAVFSNNPAAKYESVTNTSNPAGVMGITSLTAAYVGAKFTLQLESATGTAAGTYTYTVIAKPFANGVEGASVSKDVSIVIAAAAVKVPASAKAKAILQAGDPASVTSISDSVTSGSFVAGTTIGKIFVSNFSSDDTAVADTITVSMTGVGYLVDSTTAVTGRSFTLAPVNTATLSVKADGASGTGTITITTAAGASFVKTVTFFDTKPTTATAVVAKAFIKAGATSDDVFAVTVKDVLGNTISQGGVTVTAAATDTTTTVGGAATCAWNVKGAAYHCSVTGKAADKFGPVAYTITATGTGLNIATKVTTSATVTFADNIATKAVLAGPATGTPGATVEYTLTLTEKNGYPVADMIYGAGVEATGGDIFSATAADRVASGFSATGPFLESDSFTSKSGVITSKGVLPIAGVGSLSVTLIGDGISTAAGNAIDKTIGKTVLTASTEVSNPGVDAATDAANEATDAANAATDAALAAAEAADAATTAAQEASDAVAALSESVTKLIAGLQAQIKSLAAVVAKIAKKVKA
jgi:trimeric autotransporter adhesin